MARNLVRLPQIWGASSLPFADLCLIQLLEAFRTIIQGFQTWDKGNSPLASNWSLNDWKRPITWLYFTVGFNRELSSGGEVCIELGHCDGGSSKGDGGEVLWVLRVQGESREETEKYIMTSVKSSGLMTSLKSPELMTSLKSWINDVTQESWIDKLSTSPDTSLRLFNQAGAQHADVKCKS